MNDPLDASILDEAALEEIELVTQLMIAASRSASHMRQGEVDEILGIVAAG